jgi:hypothetical protein
MFDLQFNPPPREAQDDTCASFLKNINDLNNLNEKNNNNPVNIL